MDCEVAVWRGQNRWWWSCGPTRASYVARRQPQSPHTKSPETRTDGDALVDEGLRSRICIPPQTTNGIITHRSGPPRQQGPATWTLCPHHLCRWRRCHGHACSAAAVPQLRRQGPAKWTVCHRHHCCRCHGHACMVTAVMQTCRVCLEGAGKKSVVIGRGGNWGVWLTIDTCG